MSTRTREATSQSFATSSVAVASPGAGNPAQPSTVLSGDPERRSALIVNAGTVTVYLSAQPVNSIGSAFPLVAGAGLSITHGQPVFGFVGFGTATDGVLSIYTESGEPR